MEEGPAVVIVAHVAQLMRNHVVDRIDRGSDQKAIEDQLAGGRH